MAYATRSGQTGVRVVTVNSGFGWRTGLWRDADPVGLAFGVDQIPVRLQSGARVICGKNEKIVLSSSIFAMFRPKYLGFKYPLLYIFCRYGLSLSVLLRGD
jgi:hypothetical protein